MDRERLNQLARQAGIELPGAAAGALEQYCLLLQDWNQRMNLTAITDDEGIIEKHFIDSLLPLRFVRLPQGGSLVDVGTGAGFPSVPMALLRPDLRITLLDSLEKRLSFLRELCARLEVPASFVHARAEQAGRDPAHREQYDVATARAVANLALLAEYCLPLVRPGGVVLALKGSAGREEAAAAGKAVAVCGGEVEEIVDYRLPSGDCRTLVVLRKISQTSPKYPRNTAKIAKSPL